MTRLVVFLALAAALATVGAGVWAGAETHGLTGVAIQHTVVGTQHIYDFTVSNLSNGSFPNWDVLVGGFNVYGVGLTVDPVAWQAPTGWDWNGQGWKSKNDEIFYNNGTGTPYIAPPSIAPGASLSGFVLRFSQDLGDPLNAFDFLSHVFAVAPIANPANPQLFTGVSVTESSLGLNGTGTWWDAPEKDGHPHPPIPEASTVVLGVIGMLGPLSYAWARRRAVR